MSLEDEKGCGRPSVLNNDELKILIEADPCTTARQFAQEIDVSHLICYSPPEI